nr:PREDICTED: serine/threonine-protein phosphatase 7 long form homolog [Daucus carota subsp. sativus]
MSITFSVYGPLAGHLFYGFTTTARQRKDMVRDLLGLTPEQGDVRKNCLRISWLISNFGNCARLDSSAEDFDAQTIFHIRAHLLCVIGSLFPDSSGNYVNLNLLWILRDLQSVDGYSWGSAVLAYLYRKMCDSTHKVAAGFIGYATLVRVWIYERFPTLAPRHTATPLITYPLALRWTGPFTRTEVPHGQCRITRYELDNMIEANFRWRPYADLDDEHQPEYGLYLRWTAPTPLMYMAYVEWCYTDRVTRHFRFVLDIPTSPPRANHSDLHDTVNESINWEGVRESYTRLWDWSIDRALTSPPLMLGEGCTAAYMPWFLAVTRRYMVNPAFWRTAEAFQGTQDATQALLLDMESAIDPATLDVGRAQRILHGLLGRFRGPRNPPRHRGRPPVTPVEPEPGTYYTHLASSSLDRGGWSHLVGTSSSLVGDVEGTSRADGWDSWPESTVAPSKYVGDDYEGGPGGFTIRLEDDEDMSAEGEHIVGGQPQEESYHF